jgi:hypothetical protein
VIQGPDDLEQQSVSAIRNPTPLDSSCAASHHEHPVGPPSSQQAKLRCRCSIWWEHVLYPFPRSSGRPLRHGQHLTMACPGG